MKSLFIDTDVIIDFLADRQPFSREAAMIFTLAEEGKLRLLASSLTFSNLYYVLRKFEPHAKIMVKLDALSKFIHILKVDGRTIKAAIKSPLSDFEDSIQYFCARQSGRIDVIITRNTRDYKGTDIPVMTPGDFVYNSLA